MEERKNIIYTAADLQRYHSGSMNEAEMYALEKAAMDDPFLSEALEGYASTSTGEKDIIELKKRIAGKEEKKKPAIIFFNKKRTWLSVAAVVAFIFGTFYLTSRFKNKKDAILARNEVNKEVPSVEKNDSTVLIENNHAPSTASAQTDSIKINQGFVKKQQVPSLISQKANSYSTAEKSAGIDGDGMRDSMDSISATKAPIAKESQVIAETKAAKGETVRRDAADEEAILKDKTPLIYGKNKKTTRYHFSGKVVDEKGEPVSFASVKDSLGKTSVSTDAMGKFSISSNDSIFPATIASVGYNKLKMEFRSDIEQTFVLSRNTQELSEAVVTSSGQVRQKSSIGYLDSALSGKVSGVTVTTRNEPVGGKLKFNQSINDSTRKSLLVNKEIIKGDVVLSFKVKKNGNIKNIKVEKSLCKPCDEEAKRLLLTGPKWKYVNDNRTTVTISF